MPYSPPSKTTVKNVLLNIYSYILGRLREEVRRLRRAYQGLPFFHVVTDLWTERHDSNSYGSVILRFVDLAAFEVRELHLGVSLYMGRHDHVGVKNWIAHRLARFDVLPPDMSSTTTDSGANVRKSLHLIVMMSW